MPQGEHPVYRSGECEIDLVQRELRVKGAVVPLGGRAFEIIETLVQSAGELVTKDELKDRVWPGVIVGENTLQVHISAVRRALGPLRGFLKTESRRGYRLIGDWGGLPGDASEKLERPSPLQLPTRPSPTNFRAPASGLIGRAGVTRLLGDLLSAYRVVTLTGPGGIGKTALALEVARNRLPSFEGGGWLVELAALSEPDLVPTAVASGLGLKFSGGVISAEVVARAIGAKDLLLVLDNCEHVIDAAAELAETVLRLCPGAHVLATSREVLRIDGEYVYRVPALDVPPSDQDEGPDDLFATSAVDLFVARIKALDAEFSPQEGQLSAITAICRHLDGIPLAIEFAAARAATLGIQQVVAGLENRFALLTSGRRTALPRHQTLRAALDWSYELPPEPEQRLLRQLAVFVGGFTIEAATEVGGGLDAPAASVVADLANLVDKSLVGFDVTASRWSLLETIRAYALEKLAETGEAAAAAQRHAEFFRDLLVPAETSLPLQPAIEDMVRYGREIDNVRAALDWSFSSKGAPVIGVVLTAAYAPVWLHLSLLVECREWAERAFAALTPEIELSPLLRLRLHVGLGVALILTMGPVEKTRSLLATAREIAAGLDANSQLRTYWAQWSIDVVSGNSGAALSTAEQFSRIARRIGDPADILVGERLTGSALQYAGRQNEARECFERVLEGYAPPASQHHTLLFQYDQSALARAMLARVLWLQGLVDQAIDHARTSVEEAQASDMGLTLCWALHYAMCPIATMTGDLAGAERAVAQLIDCARTFNAPFWRMFGKCLQGKLAIIWGEFGTGVALLREGLATCDQTGWRLCYPEFIGTLAMGLAGLGELDEALYLAKEALARATDGGECWYVPELLRIQGAILLQQGTDQSLAAAEDCFHGGLMIAREQGALFWELRLALSLAQSQVHQHRQEDARNVLAPVYARFSEGFTIADMRTARSLLEALPSA